MNFLESDAIDRTRDSTIVGTTERCINFSSVEKASFRRIEKKNPSRLRS